MAFPYFELVLCTALVEHVFETYLDIRQYKCFQEKKMKTNIKGVDEKAFTKSQEYSAAKLFFGMLHGHFNLLFTLGWFCFGLVYVWNLSLSAIEYFGFSEENEVIRSIVFVFIQMQFNTLIEIPFSLYSTFVIEEKFGFNKQTIALFFKDILMSFLVQLVIVYPLIPLVILVIQWGGYYFWFYLWLFIIAIMLVLMTVYPIYIAPLFNKFTELKEGEVFDAIKELAIKVEFPLTKLFTVDGSVRSAHSNAYMYGFFNNKRIVIYDTLISQIDLKGVQAIVGHEMGHYKMSHTIKLFVLSLFQILVFCFLFGQFVNNESLYSSFGFEGKPLLVGLVLFSSVFSTLDIVITPLMNSLSRKFEYEADQFATDLGYELKEPLTAIYIENASNLNPDPLYSWYHNSHPTLVERITAIDARLAQTQKKDK